MFGLRHAQRTRLPGVNSRVDQQAKEPGREGAAVVETGNPVERAHERLLHQILRVLDVPEEAPCDYRRAPNVPADERIVRRRIATSDAIDERMIVIRSVT